MFLIDGNYFELVLEDEDIAVLTNIDIKELWNYAVYRRCSVCW